MAKAQVTDGGTAVSSVLGPLDEMEPDLRHLEGLITAFRILGEAVAISSLARCARETLDELERKWRTAIGALREC